MSRQSGCAPAELGIKLKGAAAYKHLAPLGQRGETFCCTSKLNSRMMNEKLFRNRIEQGRLSDEQFN
jgi:hypothetical protein